MECNKEEALRCREMAEEKFRQQDAVAAKKLAMKARQLYPELEGLAQLIPVLEVHAVVQEEKQRCRRWAREDEMDWYAILQVEWGADEGTVRKQFRKLALLLHPDKNNCAGAEAAFKLIVEAWGVLSNEATKKAYDSMRKGAGAGSGVGVGVGTGAGVGVGVAGEKKRQQRSAQNGFVRPVSACRPPFPQPPTFWTACPSCKMQYEYPRVYENRNLCCPLCRWPFLAAENPAAAAGIGEPWWPPPPRPPPPPPPPFNGFMNFPWGPCPKEVPPSAEQVVREALEKAKRERVEAQREMAKRKEYQEREQRKREKELQKANEVAKAKEVFVQMMAKARAASLKKEGEQKKEEERRKEEEQRKGEECKKEEERRKGPERKKEAKRKAIPDKKQANSKAEPAKVSVGKGASKPADRSENQRKSLRKAVAVPVAPKRSLRPPNAKECPTPKRAKGANRKKPAIEISPPKVRPPSVSIDKDTIEVPDPDFHDFDKDRSEGCFADDQVWAIYDENDGMPRFYARINKVISADPFEVRISWLEPRPISKQITVWNKGGLQCPCGEFKADKSLTSAFINTFSHIVSAEKGQMRGAFKIYPRKGHVWALHKGWHQAMQPNQVTHILDIIEVLSDFKEEEGASVMLLHKVEGFKTLYRRKGGDEGKFTISSKEILRFSHHVPAYRLTAKDARGKAELDGAWELDPASIPPVMISLS